MSHRFGRAILSQMLPRQSGPPTAGVQAFFAHIDLLTGGTLARARRWLSAAEADRYARFRLDADRQMFLLGRVMARALVGRALGVEPPEWQWAEGARGRPEIASPATDLHFNISHSADLVACVLARGREVGVDVEHLDRRPIDPSIVRRYCAGAECDDIEAQGDAWQTRFLLYWTLKESYLKARGLGVALPLSEICFSVGDPIRISFTGSLAGTSTDWRFALARPMPTHIAAVAVQGAAVPDSAIAFAPFPADLLP